MKNEVVAVAEIITDLEPHAAAVFRIIVRESWEGEGTLMGCPVVQTKDEEYITSDGVKWVWADAWGEHPPGMLYHHPYPPVAVPDKLRPLVREAIKKCVEGLA